MTFLFLKWLLQLDDEKELRWVEVDAAATRSEGGKGSTTHLGAAGLEDGGPSRSACGVVGAESWG